MVKKAAQAIPNELLRRARLERGWTQHVVADRIGAPNAMMVTRWERGKAFPSPYYVERLCQLFEQKASDLGLLRASPVPIVSRAASQQKAEARPSRPSAEPTARPSEHEGTRASLWHSTLPMPLTAFVGREREIEALVALMQNTSARLLTLTGPGGVGKTRLALSLAAAVADTFADGVCFVSLAPISDPEQVLPAIAQALGLWEVGNHPLMDHVRDFLREKYLLLLLDNFEQVAAASPHMAALALSCPSLRLLITSRAALHLSGEYEFPVPPLPTPDLTQLPEPQVLAQVAAVQLFVERAHAILPAFELTEANARTIAEICVRLDGLPLALELAAARSKLLPPQALLARLSRRLEILTGGARDLPNRQQTLRNTLQWSYDLLTPQEQRLFRQLSVFVGGCTLQAAEAVCHEEHAESEDLLGVLEGSASLVDKSFVLQTAREGNEPRLLMLETIREFGLECLEACGETATVRHAHARYYLGLAQEAQVYLEGTEQAGWLERLERESANLRAALLWALEQQESEIALRLSGTLFRFWEARRYLREGRTFLERAEASSRSIPARSQAKPLSTAGFLTTFQSGIERLAVLSQEAGVGQHEVGDNHRRAFSLYLLGYIAWATGDFAMARAHAEEGLAVARASDAPVILAALLALLGQVAFEEGEASRASALLEEALTLQQATGDMRGSIFTLSTLIRLLFAQDEVALVRTRNEERLALSQALGFRWGIADSLTVQGHLALQEGNEATAEEVFKESLALLREINDHGAIAACLQSIGVAVAAQGRLTESTWLWGAAETMCGALGESLLPVEHALGARAALAVRAELGEEAFTTAWAEGQALTPEQALARLGRPSSRHKQAALPTTNDLTPREMEVLRLLARGLTSGQIAEQLVIGPVTVNSHVRSIYNKLGVSSRAAATRFALEHHLL
jgi:predicted ATPase/DNA-binding CsgD family transcriptional regulator/transcriptional regulator with XRE-family HTH domain